MKAKLFKYLYSGALAAVVAATVLCAFFITPHTAAAEIGTEVNFDKVNPRNASDYLDLSGTETFAAWGKIILTPSAGNIIYTKLSDNTAEPLNENFYNETERLVDIVALGEMFVGVLTNTASTEKYNLKFYWLQDADGYQPVEGIKDENGAALLDSNKIRGFYTPNNGTYFYARTVDTVYKINFEIKENPSTFMQELVFKSAETVAVTDKISGSDFAVYGSDVYYLESGKVRKFDGNVHSDVITGLESAGDVKAFSVSENSVFISNGSAVAAYNRAAPHAQTAFTKDASGSPYAISDAKKLAYMKNGNSETLLLLDGESDKYVIYSVSSLKLEGTRIISTAGSSVDKFDAPKDVALSPDGMTAYVADSANHRVTVISNVFGNKTFATFGTDAEGVNASAPSKIAADGKYVYVTTEDNKLLCYAVSDTVSGKDAITPIYVRNGYVPSGSTVTDVLARDGKIYFSEMNTGSGVHRIGIFSSAAAETPSYFGINSIPYSIALNNRGTKLYSASANGVEIYDATSLALLQSINYAQIGAGSVAASSISVDYAGNIFIADNFSSSDAGIVKISRTSDGYALGTRAKIRSNIAEINQIEAVCISSSGEILALSKGKNLLLSNNGRSSALYIAAKNSSAAPEITSVSVTRVTTPTQVRYALDNYEEFTDAPTGSLFLALASKTDGGKSYYYGVFEDGFAGYIESSAVTALSPNSQTDIGSEAVALHPLGTKIYKYPYITDDAELTKRNIISATVTQDAVLTVLNNVAEYEGKHVWQTDTLKWYRVQYIDSSDKTISGYVIKSTVAANVSPTPPATKKTMKVSAEKVGGTVAFYSLPDLASSVLATLTDGVEVALAEEYDPDSEFTKVVFKNQVGYVLTGSLIKSGLTGGQIVAVTLGSVAVVVTAVSVVFIVLYVKKSKKKREQ